MPSVAHKNIIPGQRWCNTCRQYKPEDDFYRNRKYGRGFTCKPCHRGINKAAYRRNPGPKIAYGAKWREANPNRYKASALASKYRADGLTMERAWRDMNSRLPCPYCAETITADNISYDHTNGPGTPVQPTCLPCNLLKHVFDADDFTAIVALIGPEKLARYKVRATPRRPSGSEVRSEFTIAY